MAAAAAFRNIVRRLILFGLVFFISKLPRITI